MARPVGSFLGFDILLAGTQGPLDVPRQWSLPDGLSVVTADREAVLLARLRPFSLDSIVTLAARLTTARLADPDRLRAEIASSGWEPDITFMPFTLRRIVVDAIRDRELPDGADRHMTIGDMKAAEEVSLDIVPTADRKKQKSKDDIQAMALRVLQAQYVDQLGYQQFQQEVALALETIERSRDLGLDLDELFKAEYGCTFKEIAFVTFAVWSAAAAQRDAPFNARDLNRGNAIPALQQEVINAVWRHCVAGYEKFKWEAASPSVNVEGYEHYGLSPTLLWPLIERTDGNAVAPSAVDLLHRAPRGFPLDARKAIDRGCPDAWGIFNQAAGAAFEAYVGDSLRATQGAGEVLHGSGVFPAGEKQCDWVCREQRSATLVEVKSIWFRFEASMTKERTRLKAELAKDGGLADALVQLDDSARAVRGRRTQLPKNLSLHGLVVVRGEQVGLNSPYIRDLLAEILEERGRPKAIIKYQMANDLGFSHLVRHHSGGGSLGKFLRDKMSHPIHIHDDVHFAVERASDKLPPHPLSDRHSKLFDTLIAPYDPEVAGQRGA